MRSTILITIFTNHRNHLKNNRHNVCTVTFKSTITRDITDTLSHTTMAQTSNKKLYIDVFYHVDMCASCISNVYRDSFKIRKKSLIGER